MNLFYFKMQTVLCFCLYLVLTITSSVIAQNTQAPNTLNIQGVLNNANGQPVPNGSYTITFRIYTSTLGDVPEWSETQNNIAVQSGIFNTIMGKLNPLTIPFDRPYFLGIKLGNEPEMEPRIELTSTPYSLLAKNVQNNSISTDKIQANAVTIDKIASPIISSINGVTNDGGNISLVAGNNISLLSDNINKTITISAANGGTGTGSISSLTEGNGISITNPVGPSPAIGLKPNILLGPSGSLGILNQNNSSVASISSIGQGGYLNLSNSDLINTFGVIGSTLDKQPLLYLNNRLGNQVVDLKADEFSNGMLTLKSVLNNPTVQLKANENAGGLINVFNSNGLITTQLTTSTEGDGIKAGNGKLVLNSVDRNRVLQLETNTAGGGVLRLYNVEGNEALRLTTRNTYGGSLSVNNRIGNTVGTLHSTLEGNGGLFLSSANDVPTIGLATNTSNGGGIFTLHNAEGNEAIKASTFLNRQPYFLMLNRLSNPVVEMKANEFSDGEITLSSVLTNPTVRLTANENAGGLINVFNPKGDVVVRAIGEESGFIGIYNREKTEMIQMGILDDQNARITVNNRLGNPAADLFSNEFSDGELTLNSVLKNPTLRLKANDNAGGLINVFSRNNIKAAEWTEMDGNGDFKLFNMEGLEKLRLQIVDNAGRLYLRNNLGNPIAVMQASDFSDGELILNSVLNNTTVYLGANDNAGGRMRIFSQNDKLAMDLTEIEGEGNLKIFNKDSIDIVTLQSINGDGSVDLRNKNGILSAFLSSSENGGAIQVNDGIKDANTRGLLQGGELGGYLALYNAKKLDPTHEMGIDIGTQEGFLRINSKDESLFTRLDMGGDAIGNGYLNLYNNKGLNTFFVGHNEFNDGQIYLKNNLGNLGGYFTAFRDGGSIAVTDGKPGTNHRATMGSNLFGGRTTIFNNNNLMTHESIVQQNGEGLDRIVNPADITKSRVEIGGTFSKDGFISTFDNKNRRNIDLRANAEGAGIITTYKNDKIQTTLNATTSGGDIQVFNTAGINTSQIGHFDDGRGKIEVGHSNGTKVARMTSNTEGSGYIGVDNIDKNEVVRLTANTGKGGGIGVKNALNKDIFNVTQNQNHGVLQVHNATGNNTGAIYNFEDGRGIIEVGQSNGTKVVRMTSNTDGSGFIGVDNVDKKEVVRITANNGKGGGIGIKNNLGNDIINLTQDNSFGALLINNASGITLATITHNTLNGGFIGTRDQNGKDAVWLSTNATGGGQINTFNESGKIASVIGIDGLGNGALVNYNKAGTPLAGITTANASNGGYIFANHSNGKDVVRLTSLADGSGYISADNNAGKTVSYVTASTLNGGYVGVTNSNGNDRARITTNANGAGHISASNASGNNVVQMSVSNSNHGEISTSNASGAIINAIGATGTAQGYMAANNNAGQERSFMMGGANGGEIGVNDNSGKTRVLMSAASGVQVNDVDGSYLQIYNSGSSTNMILVDKFQHPRAEVKSGTILAKGPNGIEHSFMSSATAPNLGYIGVCNSAIVGSPVKAGMYTTAGNQGVIFADVKNFKMDYPGKPDKQIWYGSLEGPELAAYIRGTGKLVDGKATIDFPDHYVQVANAGTMTVMVTPLSGKSKGLAVVKKTNTNFSVEELMEGNGSYEFDWEVKCVRKGHEGFEVVRNKSDEPKPFIEITDTPTNMITGPDRINHDRIENEVIKPVVNTKNQ